MVNLQCAQNDIDKVSLFRMSLDGSDFDIGGEEWENLGDISNKSVKSSPSCQTSLTGLRTVLGEINRPLIDFNSPSQTQKPVKVSPIIALDYPLYHLLLKPLKLKIK